LDDSPLSFNSAEQFAETLFFVCIIAAESRVMGERDFSASRTFNVDCETVSRAKLSQV